MRLRSEAVFSKEGRPGFHCFAQKSSYLTKRAFEMLPWQQRSCRTASHSLADRIGKRMQEEREMFWSLLWLTEIQSCLNFSMQKGPGHHESQKLKFQTKLKKCQHFNSQNPSGILDLPRKLSWNFRTFSPQNIPNVMFVFSLTEIHLTIITIKFGLTMCREILTIWPNKHCRGFFSRWRQSLLTAKGPARGKILSQWKNWVFILASTWQIKPIFSCSKAFGGALLTLILSVRRVLESSGLKSIWIRGSNGRSLCAKDRPKSRERKSRKRPNPDTSPVRSTWKQNVVTSSVRTNMLLVSSFFLSFYSWYITKLTY